MKNFFLIFYFLIPFFLVSCTGQYSPMNTKYPTINEYLVSMNIETRGKPPANHTSYTLHYTTIHTVLHTNIVLHEIRIFISSQSAAFISLHIKSVNIFCHEKYYFLYELESLEFSLDP